MNKHPYLRAYMAGIAVPTMFLLVILTAFLVARFWHWVPIPVERIIVFPMAVVPNLWGLWNMLYVWLQSRRYLPIGLHGALLPFLLGPAAIATAAALGFVIPTFLTIAFPGALVFYYLAWKHLVGFFNEVLGIA